MSLRSVLFGLYYIQYGFLVYTSFLASANLQLQHFPSKDVLKALFMSNIRVIIHSCLNKNVPKLQSPASRTEKVSDSIFTWFLISSLFEWKSPRSASFLIVRSRSVTNFCLFHDIQHSNTHMMMLITFKPFKDIKILILILYVFFDIQDIFSSKLYFLYWQ